MQIKTNVITRKWKVSVNSTDKEIKEIIIEAETKENARLKAVSDGMDVIEVKECDS